MSNPWVASPYSTKAEPRQVVLESWNRVRSLNPELLLAPLAIAESELSDYRSSHPLASVMPVIRKLLVGDADNDSRMLVAVGDAMGRLLWVEGDQGLKARAESMMFVEGSDWSEQVAGTSAPGTALALDHAIQIRRSEHFNLLVHDWSCTAVPLHDPETGALLGVIDITGGDQAVDRHTMPLMEATAFAVENELMLQRIKQRREPDSAAVIPLSSGRIIELPRRNRHVVLHVLGRDEAGLTTPTGEHSLGRRHSEILFLLANAPGGLAGEDLAAAIYGDRDSLPTLRSEMVRLRKTLEPFAPELIPASQPYRLTIPIETDAQQVLTLIERGAHKAALSAYRGDILPDSASPGVVQIQELARTVVRDAVMTAASLEVLLDYVDTGLGNHDTEALSLILRLLPPKSPKRALLVARLEAIERADALNE